MNIFSNHSSYTSLGNIKTEKRKNGHENFCCTEISHLSVKSGSNVILNDVNLHLHCGELTAVIGRNGAGKTTLIKALLGAVHHTGDVKFLGGHHQASDANGKPRIGYVPQSLSASAASPVTVGDVIVASLSKWPAWFQRKKEKRLVHDVLSSVGAEALAQRRISDLSGGEFQRVMLSLAINPVPDILLLDEPVSGVDRAGLILFYNLVNDLRKKFDTTILLVSHDLDLIAKYADRVVLIDREIVSVGTVKEVYSSDVFVKTFGHIVTDAGNINTEDF